MRTFPPRHPIGTLHRTIVYLVGCTAASVPLLGCGDDGPTGPTINAFDRDRHPRFTTDGQTIIYYRHDERPGAIVGIYKLDLASGNVELLVEAILAGLDLHPTTDSIIFSARAAGEAEPALWLTGPDGTGTRRLQGGGSDPGHRWPSFSPDGARVSWEIRYQDATNVDTVNTLWMGDWVNGAIANPRPLGPGRRSAWRPDGAAVAAELHRPGDAVPFVIAVLDTARNLLDTLGMGYEPIWRPDGMTLAYGTEGETDRGCLGVCFVPAGGGTPVPLASAYVSFPGSWSRDGTQYVFAQLARTYEIDTGGAIVRVEESRFWMRDLATGEDRQLTF